MRRAAQKLGMSRRATNSVIINYPDMTLDDLASASRSFLAAGHLMGDKTLRELHAGLVRYGLHPAWSPDAAKQPKVVRPSRAGDLRKIELLVAKTTLEGGASWHVTHAATEDGLSQIDDGQEYGMFPIRGEAHEIELAAACVEYVMRHVLRREEQQ